MIARSRSSTFVECGRPRKETVSGPVTEQCTKGSDLAPHWLIQVHCINYVLGLLFDDLNLTFITVQNLGPISIENLKNANLQRWKCSDKP